MGVLTLWPALSTRKQCTKTSQTDDVATNNSKNENQTCRKQYERQLHRLTNIIKHVVGLERVHRKMYME